MKMLKIAALFAILFYISGCAALKVSLGTSIRALEEEKTRQSKVFDKDVTYCYKTTLEALKKWQANAFIVSENRYIIATRLDNIFKSCIDTTEVGIFFKTLETNKTQVDVSSLNYQLGQFVADNLFKYIENPEAPTCPILKEKPFRLFKK